MHSRSEEKNPDRIKKAFALLDEPDFNPFMKEMSAFLKKPLELNTQYLGVMLGKKIISQHPERLSEYIEWLRIRNFWRNKPKTICTR